MNVNKSKPAEICCFLTATLKMFLHILTAKFETKNYKLL